MDEEAEAEAIVVDAADDVDIQDEMDADTVPGALHYLHVQSVDVGALKMALLCATLTTGTVMPFGGRIVTFLRTRAYQPMLQIAGFSHICPHVCALSRVPGCCRGDRR